MPLAYTVYVLAAELVCCEILLRKRILVGSCIINLTNIRSTKPRVQFKCHGDPADKPYNDLWMSAIRVMVADKSPGEGIFVWLNLIRLWMTEKAAC